MKLETKHKIAIIFIAAVAVRILFGFGLFFNHNSLVSYTGDAADYLNTAGNFLYKGIWSASPVDPEPDNFRTPIYPLFLLFFYRFNISFNYAGFVQDLIMAITAVLIYVLGRKIFSEKAVFPAAVFFALNPYLASSFISKAIMTEAFVIFFLVISLFNLGIYIAYKKSGNLYYGSVFLALAALTKPQFFFFGVFLFLAVFFAGEQKIIKRFIYAGLIFLTMLSPWLYYNFFVLKVFQFSSNPLAALYQDTGFFQEFLKGGHGPAYNDYTWDRAKERLGVDHDAQLFEPHRARKLAKSGIEFIRKNLFWFVVYDIVSIPRLFWHDTTVDAIIHDFGIDSAVLGPGGMDINAVKNIFRGEFYAAAGELRTHPIWYFSLFLKLTTLLASGLALLNFFLQWKFNETFPKNSLFLLLFILLYAAIVSPLGQQRYRAPISPFMAILAFDSIRLIYLRRLSHKISI
ncbi:MAG: glycosyltransferase family 39 protein [Patescibacteria group bacterium]